MAGGRPVPAATGEVPSVPGYRTGRLLGSGGSGEVWSAVSQDGGEHVALKVVRGDPDDAQALRERLVLGRVRHPHVVRLRDVVAVPGVGTVLVLDRALGGSLGALVATRGPLDVGEVVTVVTPLAGALADMHQRGLVHGDVSAGNVLFDDRGRPLLGDLGVSRIVGEGAPGARYGTPGYVDPAAPPGRPPGPAGDVFGLAAVAWLALTGRLPGAPAVRAPLVAIAPQVPPALALLLEEALDVDPDRRPGPRELAARCYDAAPAEPVRLVPTDPGAAPAEVVTHRVRAAAAAAEAEMTPRRSRRHRRRPRLTVPLRALVLAGALAALAVAVAWLAVPLLGGGGHRPEQAGTPAPVAAARAAAPAVPPAVAAALAGDDPRAAVPALAWVRARAFSTGSADLLERASAPDGQALAADLAQLKALRDTGTVLDGLTFDVRRTELVSRDGPLAVVDAAVVTSAHRQVDATGSTLRTVRAGDERLSRLVLRQGPSGWQVVRVG